MGRAPCCDKANVKKGPWSPEEDAKLKEYIEKHGTGGNWIALPQKVGLKRCGKSCRLRWLNYLRPNIKHGEFSDEEDRKIYCLFASIGSRWSIIASQLPGRTDNDIKNYWNTKLKKKLLGMAPSTQYQRMPNQPTTCSLPFTGSFLQNSTTPCPYPPYEFGSSGCLTAPVRPWPGVYESMPSNFTTLVSPNSSALDGFLGPFHGNHNQVNKEGRSKVLEARCSSSKGNGVANQIGHGMEVDGPDYRLSSGHQNLFSFSNGGDEDQKFLISNDRNSSSGAAGGGFADNQLDYSIEEINQLISTNNMSNTLNFLVDEIKTEQRVLEY